SPRRARIAFLHRAAALAHHGCRRAAAALVRARGAGVHRRNGRRRMTTRILIVEDNPDLAFGLRNNFEIEGYEVDVADDGLKGLARAREWAPHLIVLDLMIPGMDGY